MLKKFQDMGKLLKQAKEMKEAMKTVQAELQKTKIPITTLQGKIKVTLNGELEVMDYTVDPSLLDPKNKAELEKATKAAFAEAIKKAKDLATSKLSAISGGLMGG